ncbi:MAG: sigma-54-dependent Fis family transcriptional regulator [Bacteroidetes bacterium]|nr:MAG: sigma-54-dependent Fis family transcriptional regulator [Bacteroidota bacterium]
MKNLQSIKQRYGIIGRSPLLDRALSTAVRVANTDLTVLITGKSGVGKEVFSKIIHDNSPRKHNKFIAINCGAIPSGTINSELFGHEKGAFTGAINERKGYFESHNGGTMFLDEIGEMPLDTQAYLLRVLESGEFIRVGSNKILTTDIRIIAATNVDLEDKIKKGKFREDLFYRLNIVPISLPALSERREDIYMLFRKFAIDFAEKYHIEPLRLEETAKLMLENYSWPGNIRELKNLVEQLSILSEDRLMDVEELLNMAPQLRERRLPVISGGSGSLDEKGTMQEREILYNLLFDMKGDLNDLKTLVFELIKDNDLRVPDVQQFKSLKPGAFAGERTESYYPTTGQKERHVAPAAHYEEDDVYSGPVKPVMIDKSVHEDYDQMEVVEENLSLEENTKELIKKALKKHGGRRKDAARDLGISERTLYRKIKEYEME